MSFGTLCLLEWMVAPALSKEDQEIAYWLAEGVTVTLIAEWLQIPLRSAHRRVAAVRASIKDQTGRPLEPIKGEAVKRVDHLSDAFFRVN